MYERADIAMRHAFKGFGISYEEAIRIIKDAEGLDADELEQRKILLAAVNNLIEFSVAEEYQMYEELEEAAEELDLEDEDDINDILLPIFAKYNRKYSWVEDMDIEYAMIIAAGLMRFKTEDELMYMTMGDERVRPWHLQYEGFTAPKSQFPAWLIPPIEHGCRCYLVEAGTVKVRSQVEAKAVRVPEMPEWFDKTFKESVALGGRIFSDEHPYFQIQESDINWLDLINERIHDKILNG